MKNLWLALLGSAAVLQLASSRQVQQQQVDVEHDLTLNEAFPLEVEQDIGYLQEQGEVLLNEQLQGQGQLQERGWKFGFPKFDHKKGFHHKRDDDDDGKKKRGRRHRRHKRDDDDDGKKGRRHRRHKRDDDDDGKKGRRHRRHRGKK